ncbi:Uncharacterised protein [Yersinia aldovae]|uniref:Lipoprotein n=1 Tax=Yersinia aldovae TaxID=29483 RepID=A0A0T9TKY1_YERAL|nr:hypothetical protein [Yersinia aldovae]CNK87457.1 Uncharacterised protein [Yersinia aldovae]
MKLLTLWLVNLFFISTFCHATLIIEPNNKDRAYLLKTQDANSSLTYKEKPQKKKEIHCRYQLIDYRTERNNEVGCAINKNERNSKQYN